MFACPMASLQGIVSDLSPLPPPTESRATTSSACHTQSTNIPFSVDPIHLKAVNCTAESDGSLLVSFDTSEPGYFIGQTPMTVGKYTWKVSHCCFTSEYACTTVEPLNVSIFVT